MNIRLALSCLALLAFSCADVLAAGKVASYQYTYAGTPVGAPVSSIDPPPGAVVIDTTTGIHYRKIGAKGSNASGTYSIQPSGSMTTTAVAAAGSTASDAAALGSSSYQFVTSDSAAKGVKLPTSQASQVIVIVNNSSTAAEVYPATGGTINGGSANVSVTIPASKGVICISSGANTWVIFDLAAKSS